MIPANWYAGVDVGGTNVRVALAPADLSDRAVVKSASTATPKHRPGAIASAACDLLDGLLEDVGAAKDDLLAVGLASAGPLDLREGAAFNNANLGFSRVPLVGPVAARFPGVPVHLANDANAAALGVHRFEASEDEGDDMVYVTISTGIGAGAVVGGRLLLGKEGNAAEVGHAIVEPSSELRCGCGARGCWEVFSSGTGVAGRARERAASAREEEWPNLRELVGGDPAKIDAKLVFQAARLGDPLARRVVEEAAFYVKVGFGLLNNFYDPVVVYVGGAMAKDEDLLLDPVRRQFAEDPLPFTVNHPPEIKRTVLGDAVGLLGALALAKYANEGHPLLGGRFQGRWSRKEVGA
ncbi:MAG: ROK family protein [Promethearchaeota archaeon]